MSSDNLSVALRTLIIDNYDSYTFNLYQYCCVEGEALPVVIRNDQFSWEFVRDTILPSFDCVIISPGPGRPERDTDFGISANILRYATIPILGVCLGHQGMATVFGGKVVHGREAVHGRSSPVSYKADHPSSLFEGLPNPFNAVRYHSLVISRNELPPCLRVTAWTLDPGGEEAIIQGVEHTERPIWGVQFHPESICTEGGIRIIENFRRLALHHLKSNGRVSSNMSISPELGAFSVIPEALVERHSIGIAEKFEVHVQKLHGIYFNSERVFTHMFAADDVAFWLDSAKVEQNLSRFSYMGSASGPMSFLVKYYADRRSLAISRPENSQIQGLESVVLSDDDNFFAWMSRTLQTLGLQSIRIRSKEALPFNFTCGMVGFFGYEMKAESLGRKGVRSGKGDHYRFRITHAGSTPDATFVFADRVIVFDHIEKVIYLMGVQKEGRSDLGQWMDETAQQLRCMKSDGSECHNPSLSASSTVKNGSAPSSPVIKPQAPGKRRRSTSMHRSGPTQYHLHLAHSRKTYLSNVRVSLKNIADGETYEVCLTTQIRARLPDDAPDPYEAYKHLRKRNPAPYGAFLRFGAGFAIASSSPERFLRMERNGLLTMKPIKGTVPRATKLNGESEEEVQREDERRRVALEMDEKNRAENLMIVDLIRNDLNQISEPSSVCVPALMRVESYATVHQLVTTVQGQLRADLNAVDAVMHSFPPGSMTGAPKLRTVQILETLEEIPRGAYSGVLGYFSLNGAAEFNVVIRTAVFNGNEVSVGAGGAIVALSEPEDEFAEMLLKANSVLPSIMQVYCVGPLDTSKSI